MDPRYAVGLLGGVAESRDLKRMGVAWRALSSAVADGSLLKVRRGCYAHPSADPVAVAATGFRGTPTCVTAAEQLGLPLLDRDSRIHLAFPRGTSFGGAGLMLPANVVAHYVSRGHRPLDRGAEAVDSSVRCLSPEHQLILVDAALNRGMLAPSEIDSFEFTGKRRRAWLARYCDRGAESLPETLARLAFMRSGMSVETQVLVPGVGRVDMIINGRVCLEVDGRAYHSDPAAFGRDRRRDRAAFLAGYIPMRYTFAEIVYGIDDVVEQVREALSVCN